MKWDTHLENANKAPTKFVFKLVKCKIHMLTQLCQSISELPTLPNQLKLQVELDGVFNEPRKQAVIPRLHAM